MEGTIWNLNVNSAIRVDVKAEFQGTIPSYEVWSLKFGAIYKIYNN